MPERWHGPEEGEVDTVGTLLVELPPERWPYGPPDWHDEACDLRVKAGAAGAFCDCEASAFDPCQDCSLFGCETCAAKGRP